MTATTENTVNSKNPQQNSVSQFIQRLNYLKEFNLVSVLAEAKNSPELQPRINKMIQFSRQELVRRMQLLQEKKQVQMVDADLAADMILSMGLGALILTKLDAENSPEPKRMEEILGAFNSLIMTNQIDLNGIRES
jgi:DNA-binding Lrp family transcriptional regulator